MKRNIDTECLSRGSGMDEVRNELDELSREIRKIISDNKKFLDRVMDDEFEPDGDESMEADEEEAGRMVEL